MPKTIDINLKDDETVDALLPWNAPEECRVKT